MNLVFPRLYAILDSSLLTTSELVLAETLAGSGVELIQYRNKKAPSRELFEISLRLSTAMAQRGVRFIVNDRPDIALLSSAGGVQHVVITLSAPAVGSEIQIWVVPIQGIATTNPVDMVKAMSVRLFRL